MTTERDRHDFEKVRSHFAGKARGYEDIEANRHDEHAMALGFLASQGVHYGIGSILDVGAGVGTDLIELKKRCPEVRVAGIEPVAEMRAVGHERGLSPSELIDGDILSLDFPDKHFDCVCAFAVLHHVKNPDMAVAEMIRVARKAVFISDSNCFGGGGAFARFLKQAAHAAGLWPLVDFLKSGGRGSYYSEGDGLFYSYSTYFNYPQLRSVSQVVHTLNTKGTGVNPYRTASHTAMLAVLK